MNSDLPASDFHVWHRAHDGSPGFRYSLNDAVPDDVHAVQYRCVVKAINIARRMLKNDTVRQAYMNLAKVYSFKRPNLWFKQPPLYNIMSEPKRLKIVTDNFMDEILARFPLVFIDFTIQNPDDRGAHFRREWDHFNSAHQNLIFAGTFIESMGIASAAARDVPEGHAERLQFQTFMFVHVNMLIHELGHVFVTYLSKGREKTPPTIKPYPSWNDYAALGEFGRTLETELFGGTIDLYRPSIHPLKAGECGKPYIEVGHRYYAITEAAICDVSNGVFHFPYEHDENPDDENLPTWGAGLPKARFAYPLDFSRWAFLRPSGTDDYSSSTREDDLTYPSQAIGACVFEALEKVSKVGKMTGAQQSGEDTIESIPPMSI